MTETAGQLALYGASSQEAAPTNELLNTNF